MNQNVISFPRRGKLPPDRRSHEKARASLAVAERKRQASPLELHCALRYLAHLAMTDDELAAHLRAHAGSLLVDHVDMNLPRALDRLNRFAAIYAGEGGRP